MQFQIVTAHAFHFQQQDSVIANIWVENLSAAFGRSAVDGEAEVSAFKWRVFWAFQYEGCLNLLSESDGLNFELVKIENCVELLSQASIVNFHFY